MEPTLFKPHWPHGWFVYRSLPDGETELYQSGLRLFDARYCQAELEALIKSEGDNAAGTEARIGNDERKEDFPVAQKLGLIDKSFASFEDYYKMLQTLNS